MDLIDQGFTSALSELESMANKYQVSRAVQAQLRQELGARMDDANRAVDSGGDFQIFRLNQHESRIYGDP